VADAVCFLLSDLARAISGEILHVDGGFHAMGAPPGLAADPPDPDPSVPG
jgi:enoyl-[acyl-carrier-protein] reductase (NADH)